MQIVCTVAWSGFALIPDAWQKSFSVRSVPFQTENNPSSDTRNKYKKFLRPQKYTVLSTWIIISIVIFVLLLFVWILPFAWKIPTLWKQVEQSFTECVFCGCAPYGLIGVAAVVNHTCKTTAKPVAATAGCQSKVVTAVLGSLQFLLQHGWQGTFVSLMWVWCPIQVPSSDSQALQHLCYV